MATVTVKKLRRTFCHYRLPQFAYAAANVHIIREMLRQIQDYNSYRKTSKETKCNTTATIQLMKY